MFATKITLLGKLLGTDSRQFVIPIYQRKYKWTSEQCNRLIDDVIKAGKTGKEHFTGTVVYQELPGGTFKKEHLVDGQQRITTIMLILKALQLLSKPLIETDNDYLYVYNKISNYLYADKDDPSMGLKLVPSKNDADTFNAVMKAGSFIEASSNPAIAKNEDNNLYNNFLTVYERLSDEIKNGNHVRGVILEGLMLLVVVEMSLDMSDDPQAIFESINSLGLKLTNADLIRNYLLMSSADQKELYEKYWEVIQDSLIGERNMEDFVFNYLMMKKSYAINYADIYKEYVSFANKAFGEEPIDKEFLLKDLFAAAIVYKPFLGEDKRYSSDTNMLMQELRDMAQTTAYPFLMKAFLDKEAGVIDEKTLDKVINLIIVYLVRRTICGVPTHSLRGFMLNLYNRVFKVEANKSRYFEAIYAFLIQLETTDRLRDLTETAEALKTAEIYKNVKFATYLLYKIENGRYPKAYGEFTKADFISVEHIMPQTLTDEWISMLGADAEEIHKDYLNTLGNLSLSSRSKNSIMSNETFVSKRDVLMASGSKFIELNKDITPEQTVFGKKEIEDREERLSKIVCSKYDLGKPNISGIKFENSVEFVCSTDVEEVFGSAVPIAYKLFGEEIPADSFNKILVGVAKALLAKNPEMMRGLAANNFNPWDGGEKPCVHYDLGESDSDLLIGENIRLHTGYNAVYSVQLTTLLMREFGVDADQLIIYLKKDSVKTDNILPKKRRVEIVRKVLSELAAEEKVVYDPANMPKSDDWIKFQTAELIQTFPYNQETKWDGEPFCSISYLEYHLSSNTIVLTYKTIKKTSERTEVLEKAKEELGLLDEVADSSYWHLKKYQIDYKAVYQAQDREAEMKNQIESRLADIKLDLERISAKLA